MKTNQQEKCAHKKNLGESCSQCNEAWNDMTSPHQEGWAERFDEKFPQKVGGSGIMGIDFSSTMFTFTPNPSDIKAFIRQELTTLHKADCERFRGMIGEYTGEPEVDQFRLELRNALSKMEEEV